MFQADHISRAVIGERIFPRLRRARSLHIKFHQQRFILLPLKNGNPEEILQLVPNFIILERYLSLSNLAQRGRPDIDNRFRTGRLISVALGRQKPAKVQIF